MNSDRSQDCFVAGARVTLPRLERRKFDTALKEADETLASVGLYECANNGKKQ
ncbi:hypothetical protein M3A49_00965 [Paraburkholderia sp. CNPSo 3076]|uniref:hypothetical protein n=1 Tax=Paraburkholderia sp. CNPSo 3076 TaxID=2940936 RepID=UPI0022532AD5|nr:hypothetical protein [Paraburkholderia sp. CNPSo 3076]MCX5538082.1 hypothetical protein [Paraburkholderia sp. CNPSo 3076]